MEGVLTKNCDKLLTILGNSMEVLATQKRPSKAMTRLVNALGVRLVDQ